jgi:hypothetical protein
MIMLVQYGGFVTSYRAGMTRSVYADQETYEFQAFYRWELEDHGLLGKRDIIFLLIMLEMYGEISSRVAG